LTPALVEYTQSGKYHLYFIMMEKLAQPGKGGGRSARPPSFTLYHPAYKVVLYAPAERAADTLPQFLLYPYMSSVTAPFPLLSLLPLL
jgi:hypothetical protein